jgi:hypothetical protein
MAAAVILTLAAVAFGGTAVARWSAAGIGTGPAATGTTQALTLSPATAAAQLFPGGQTGVVLTITNPNPGTVRVGSLLLDTTQGSGGFAVDGAHAACGLSVLSFAAQTNGADWAVPGVGSLSVTMANSLSMSVSAASACQGATFAVYLKAVP